MKKLLLTLLAHSIFQFSMTYAQYPLLDWGYDLSGQNTGASVWSENTAVDNSGNVFSVGRFQGAVNFNMATGGAIRTSAGGIDGYVVKNDTTGAYQFMIQLGGTDDDEVQGVALDDSGNVYITGLMNSPVIDFDPSGNVANVNNTSTYSAFVAKYNNQGQYKWAFAIPAALGYSIATDQTGNLYVTGRLGGSASDFDPGSGTVALTYSDNFDIFLAKYNRNGNYQWAFSIGGTGFDYPNEVATDASGNVIITGELDESNVDLDPGSGTVLLSANGTVNKDIFVAKYNSAGAYQWAFNLGSTGGDYGYSVATDNSDNIYVTGSFTNTVDFIPGSGTSNLTSAGNSDIFIAKYNAAGTYQWAKKFGSTNSDIGYKLRLDDNGYLYVTGAFSNTVNFQTTGTFNLTTAFTNNLETFCAKYATSNGAYQWAFKITGNANYWVIGNTIAVDGFGYFYLTGQYAENDIDMDPSSSLSTILTSTLNSGSYNVFFGRYTINTCNTSAAGGPGILSSRDTLCSADNEVILTANGSLNGNLVWRWYTGACGGTLIGTGNSITVYPTTTDHTYYARGEGGCAPPGQCGSYSTFYIVPTPSAPTANGATLSGPGSVTLTATGNDIEWYDQPVGGTLLGTGNSYTTPVINSTTTYYVQNDTTWWDFTYFVGREFEHTPSYTTNSFILGQEMRFTAYKNCILKSFKVYTQTPGNRQFKIRNSSSLVDTAFVYVPDDSSRVTVNWYLPGDAGGVQYWMGTDQNVNNAELGTPWPLLGYKSDINGFPYPYTNGPVFRVTGCTINGNYYLYFYDFEVERIGFTCPSERVPVVVDIITGIDNTTTDGENIYPNPTDGLITIETLNPTGIYQLQDITGKVLLSGSVTANKFSLDISALSKGIYLLSLFDGEQQVNRKVVKE